jgi:hypothetical protein
MTIAEKTYIGKGVVHIKNRASGGYRFLANCESVTQSFETEEKSVPNNTAAGGGKWDSLTRITAAKAAVSMYDLSPENLALATNGSTAAIVITAITDEALTTGTVGSIVPTSKMINTTVAPVVTGAGGTPTYVLNTDYTVSPAGITPKIGGAMTATMAFLVDYTPAAGSIIEMLTAAAGEYTLMIDGLNEADSGKAVRITMHRAKPAAASEIAYIGDDFATLPVEFELLSDSSIVAAGKSKYAMIEMAS